MPHQGELPASQTAATNGWGKPSLRGHPEGLAAQRNSSLPGPDQGPRAPGRGGVRPSRSAGIQKGPDALIRQSGLPRIHRLAGPQPQEGGPQTGGRSTQRAPNGGLRWRRSRDCSPQRDEFEAGSPEPPPIGTGAAPRNWSSSWTTSWPGRFLQKWVQVDFTPESADFSIGPWFWPPASDSFGRERPVLISTSDRFQMSAHIDLFLRTGQQPHWQAGGDRRLPFAPRLVTT